MTPEFDLINRPTPVMSVPKDKLHDGAFYLSVAECLYIATGEVKEKDMGRRVKWFFADEVDF